jgi:SecY
MDATGGGGKKARARAAAGQSEGPLAPRGGNAWTALAVTLLVPLAAVALTRVGLPGVDENAISRPWSRLHLSPERSSFSAFALGIMPFISASLLVELVAFVVPAWSPLRNGGPAGRAKLGRATAWLAVALSAFQAFGVARMLQALGAKEETSDISVPLVMITLVGGAMLLGLLGDFATRRGLVSGFMTIYLAPQLSAASLAREIGSTAVVATLLGALGAAGATWWVLRGFNAPAKDDPAQPAAPYRASAGAADVARLGVPTLPSGLLPLFVTAGLITLGFTLHSDSAALAPLADALVRSQRGYASASLALIVGLAVVFGWMLASPNKVAALWRRAGSRVAPAELEAEARARLRSGVLVTLLYLIVLFVDDRVVHHFQGMQSIVLTSAMVTAVALDVIEAWKARRRMPELVVVWPEHRAYAIAVAREVLEAAGIPLVVANERYRRLVPISPLVPFDLLVPAPHAARAAELLAATLGPGAQVEEAAAMPRRAPAPLAIAAGEWAAAGASAVLAAGLLAFVFTRGPSRASEAPPRGPARPESLQLLAVDDDVDFFEPIARTTEGLSPCLAFFGESVPNGLGKQAIRRYARCKVLGQKTPADARAELLAWGRTLELPAGDRLGVAWVDERDEDTDKTFRIGVRSYLLKPPAVIDGSDVQSAEVSIQGERGFETVAVAIELTPAGGDRFYRFTAANVGKRMAIVVDGDVASAVRILSPILGGHVQITMNDGDRERKIQDAERLADELMGRTTPAAAPPASTD